MSGAFLGWVHSGWDVFLLFLLPIGGGIPAGVVLARSRGMAWPTMMILYFISDIVLACVFEPLMLGMIAAGKRSSRWAQFNERLRLATKSWLPAQGLKPGPVALIGIAFGADPMTGRAVAHASGHRFVTGWMLSITGDMLFFTMLMASTLWLNRALGDGTATTVVMMVLMFIVPPLVRWVRSRFARTRSPGRGL